MQKLTLVCLVLVAFVVAAVSAYNGQDIYAEPNCSIVTDPSRKFRDISDPTHYWVCPAGAEKAEYIQCPANFAFLETENACVEWSKWKYIEPYTVQH